MKKKILYIMFILFTSILYAGKIQDDFARITLNQEINEQSIPGYVYFEGFDFKGYTAESDGIEPMLSKTLVLLDYYYGVKK